MLLFCIFIILLLSFCFEKTVNMIGLHLLPEVLIKNWATILLSFLFGSLFFMFLMFASLDDDSPAC